MLPQSSYKRGIRLQDVLLTQGVRYHPLQTLPIEANRLSGERLNQPHGKLDDPIVVFVR